MKVYHYLQRTSEEGNADEVDDAWLCRVLIKGPQGSSFVAHSC